MRLLHALIALSLFAASSAGAAGQDKIPPAKPPIAKGETVSELDKAIFYVFQAKNNDYWFGSNERGVYRYDGKTLVNFTKKDGLAYNCIRGIQEDKSGNIYFTTSAWDGGRIYTHAISRFDGTSFSTLPVTENTAWKLQPDDLWFADAQDTGAVYRYDGKSLHRLTFPKTKAGDEAIAKFPRSKYPNIKSSPYDVYTIFKDKKGHLWFGTGGLGACRFDGQSFHWLYENHLTDTPQGGSFGIRSILEDKAGAFWICNTRYRFKLDAKDAPEPEKGFIKYKREKGIEQLKDLDGADHVYFMSILEDAQGALWMASYGSGVWRYDGKTTTHYPIKEGNKVTTLFAIYKDNRGDLWLGTHEAGALKFNGKTFEKFKP